MSDDFDDDDFDFDDSFLNEVDNITAKATSGIISAPPIPDQKTTTYLAATNTRNNHVLYRNNGFSRPAIAGPSKPVTPRLPHPPSSDDFDDLSLPEESMAVFDKVTTRLPTSTPFSRTKSTPKQSVIPSSRLGLGRSSSSGGVQTHLNFRRENQSTKGKRWDRTAFAESGRRINVEKSKAKGKGKGKGYQARSWGRDDDEEDLDDEEEEEEEFEPLVPGPKPFVDPNKPYEPQRHLPNPGTVTEYIYPTNRPKRDYQYEIVQACFTDNCLVALPTGLGKTFVAGVVMLNFYRWFPTGKIVFLAPTKPLVNQQIEACQMTCGIPSADAAVMTGSSLPAAQRAKLWREKRVFYCTPQTLDNDLKNKSVDPCDIVLAVFDEAHKASGSYAYTTILAYITAHHPFFRVLALTATPGADVPRVQSVVDALHISRIEIREAEAPEIRKYMNEKRTEKHFVQMGEVISDFRDRWADLMKPFIKKLVDADILTDRDFDAKRLRPFRLTSKRMEIARDRTSKMRWAFGPLGSLEKMARAMGNLLEFSIGMFHTTLTEIAGNTTAQGKKTTSKAASGSIRNNFEFQKLVRDVEAEINSIRVGRKGKTKADKHPKMVKTLELLLEHFSQAAEDEEVHGKKNDTRAMVFCSFREGVLEIVDMLNEHKGILSATKFVGQSQGKQESDKGFNQKEQKQTIADFKDGKFNVLVSTSIGEEGLDIGEVDFVVIYDMPKQSIKLLQRIGRTGRKRDGKVHVLMSEGREDANWDTAQQTHRDIQEEILHSRNLELFEDVERLLPPGKMPVCTEQEMPVDPWDPEEGKSRKRLSAVDREDRESAKKVKKQRGHEIPEDGLTGFKSVAELLRDCGKLPRGKKGKKSAVETDEEEEEVEERVESRSKTKGKGKAKKKVANVLSESDESETLVDLDDLFATMDKEKGNSTTTRPVKRARSGSAQPQPAKRAPRGRSKKDQVVITRIPRKEEKVDEVKEDDKVRHSSSPKRSTIDFLSVEPVPRRRALSPPMLTPPSSPPTRAAPPPPLSPESPTTFAPDPFGLVPPGATKLSPSIAAKAGFSQIASIDMTWEDDLISSPAVPIRPKAVPLKSTPNPLPASGGTPVPSLTSSLQASGARKRIMGISRPKNSPSAVALHSTASRDAMPPPPIPLHKSSPAAALVPSSPAAPIRSSPIVPSPIAPSPRRVGRRRAGLPPEEVPRRSRARPRPADESPIAQPQRRKRSKNNPEVQRYLDLDVEISGSEGSADEPSSDVESESDRLFAGEEFQPTQAPRGYNQRAAYMAGMSTQVADRQGLKFNSRYDTDGWLAKARKPVLVSDDEAGSGSENEYEMGSFVCDDEDVQFDTQTQSDPLDSQY